MTPEGVFAAANLLAMLSWITLALAPWLGARPGGVARILTGRVVPALFAAAYVILIGLHFFGGAGGGFSTLAAVARLFENPWLLLAGWLHYLAFDLLVGCAEEQDARERGVPRLLLLPCLALTFLFGPAGWLAYQAVRAACKVRTNAAAVWPQ
jgi:hypothetical protein